MEKGLDATALKNIGKEDVKAKSLEDTLPWLMAIAPCHLAPYVHNKFHVVHRTASKP